MPVISVTPMEGYEESVRERIAFFYGFRHRRSL